MSGATQVDRTILTNRQPACQTKMQSAKQAERTGKNGITGSQANREADKQADRMKWQPKIQPGRKTNLRRSKTDGRQAGTYKSICNRQTGDKKMDRQKVDKQRIRKTNIRAPN